MTTWFHTIILATCAAATIAVGVASAAVYSDISVPAAKKSDRLQALAAQSDKPFMVVEHRQAGVSVITRIPAPIAN
jgi:hypothetical protein